MERPVEQAVRALAAKLRVRFRPRLGEVRLFGSYARGEAHEESDVDVFAVVDELTWPEKVEAVEMGAEVSLDTGLYLSPTVMARADFDRQLALESAFAREILREGVLL